MKSPSCPLLPEGSSPIECNDMGTQHTRFWLNFPPQLITRPLLWELGKNFPIVTNIRQASITDEIGIVSLSMEGEADEVAKAVAWLESQGVRVDPVEMNTIAS